MKKSEDQNIDRAIWEGDIEYLQQYAGCICCCGEHTFSSCPAKVWGGCRGGPGTPADEYNDWKKHYMRFHGMTEDEFDGK